MQRFRITSLILAGVLLFSLLPASASDISEPERDVNAFDGDGPYTISTANELGGLALLVNEGRNFQGKTITLTANIDLSGYTNWTPIGISPNRFAGIFDGGGHVINNLTINRTAETDFNIGLFGVTDTGSTVRNIGLVGASVRGFRFVGGIAGFNHGTVENCYSTGEVSASNNVIGGIAGNNSGTVRNCYSTGRITGDGNLPGGIVGNNDGTIENCWSASTIHGANYTGGIAGQNNSRANIINCVALGTSVSRSVTTNTWIGRITGSTAADGTLSGNAAWNGMSVTTNGVPKSPIVNSGTGIDGLSVAAGTLNTDGYFRNLFEGTGVVPKDISMWTFATGKLPGLFGETVDMPPHLAPPPGFVTVTNGTGTGSYVAGETVTLTANPPATGQGFKEWNIVPGVSFVGNTNERSQTVRFIMPAASVAATAVYTTAYSLTVSDGSGGGSNHIEGAAVTITANAPPAGQGFREWIFIPPNITFINGTDNNSNTVTFIMPASPVAAMAMYAIAYPLTVIGASGSGDYAAGAIVTLTADAAPEGQWFDSWEFAPAVTFAGGTNQNSRTVRFIMPSQDVTATARYIDDNRIYTAQYLPGGLSINEETGEISGKSIEAGTYFFVVVVNYLTSGREIFTAVKLTVTED
jgi:hypothetical protein